MKRHFDIISICFLAIYLISCENNLDEIISTTTTIDSNKISTRSTSSWDLCTECLLPSGRKVILPWGDGAKTTIPDETRKDVKIETGWTILDSTVDFIGISVEKTNADSGSNYLLLYNINTGVLKGFYYAETIESNNCGFWQLGTSSPTKLFNFAPDFAIPISGDSPQQVALATITSNGTTKGFEFGWNCFILELAYDENSHNEKLNISGFAMDEAVITLAGSYDSKSSGTIVTSTGGQSNLVNGVASGFGSASKQWIIDRTGPPENKDKAIKFVGSIISEMATSGISGIVSKGLSAVFGSFLGSSKTSSDLTFSTNGKVTIEGKLVTPSSGLISPIAGLKLGKSDMKLGIWNIQSRPNFYIESAAELVYSFQNIYGKGVFEYKVKREMGGVTIVKNPTYKGEISYTQSAVIYKKYKGEYKNLNYIDPWLRPNSDTYYTVKQDGILYSDDQTEITTCMSDFVIGTTLYPTYATNTYPISKPAGWFANNGYNLNSNIFMKVLVTLKDSNDTHFSSKTFMPYQSFRNMTCHPRSWSRNELLNLGFNH